MKYVKSNYPHAEHKFPSMRGVPDVVLPRSTYLPHELAAGKRNVIAISDAQYRRLMGDELFKSMLRAGQYEFLEEMPSGSKTADEKLAELAAENSDLKAKLEGTPEAIEDLSKRLADSNVSHEEKDRLIADLQKKLGEKKGGKGKDSPDPKDPPSAEGSEVSKE